MNDILARHFCPYGGRLRGLYGRLVILPTMISGAEVTAIVLSLETTGPMLIRALGKEKWVLVPCKDIHKRRYRRHTDLHIQPHSKAISDGKVPRVKCSTFSYWVDHQLRLPNRPNYVQ